MRGPVRLAGNGLQDDNGYFNPVFYHHGDAGIAYRKGELEATLDISATYGQMGYRMWGALNPSFWDDYLMNDDDLGNIQELNGRYGLKLMWDGGDLFRRTPEERSRVRNTILNVGRRECFASISVCNEGNDNGGGHSAEEMADWLGPIAETWPDLPIWVTTGGAGHEWTNEGIGKENYNSHWDMDNWNPNPARLTGKHGYRDGSIVDKARHSFSFTYEGKPKSWLTVDDEPPGVSAFVSVIANRDQMTPEGVNTIFLTSLIAKCWWVFFPGIEKNTEPIGNFGMYLDKNAQTALKLPPDLFTYEHLRHGGEGQSGRIYGVTDSPGDETARCDHCLSDSGKYVVSCYDEPPRQSFEHLSGRESDRIENAPWGFVSIGDR